MLLLVLFISLFSFSTFAVEERVYDEAGLFSDTQIGSLENEIASLRQSIKLDFVIVTTNETNGKKTAEYADDFYDKNGFGFGKDKSGILFLINMENRQIYLSTSGSAIHFYTDNRIDTMLNLIANYMVDNNYFRATVTFLTYAEEYYIKGIPDEHYVYDSETGKVSKYYSLTNSERAFAFWVPTVVCLVFILTVVGKYSIKAKINPYPFRQQSRLEITQTEDVFLGATTTSRQISTNSGGGGSGGGSSTHSSSGGTTHGGGGRGF